MEWIRIYDLANFLDHFAPAQINPNDPKYIPYWREIKRNVIEGVWYEDHPNHYRYGPGNLGFYHHYCTIYDVDPEQGGYGHEIRPLIRDIEWHRAYYFLEAKGFSGFADDDNCTCDRAVTLPASQLKYLPESRRLAFTRSDGRRKEFVPARTYLFETHTHPLGRPLYFNESQNHLEFGSRGGGKSLFYVLAGAKYELCCDGIRHYHEGVRRSPPAALIDFGAGVADKSEKTLRSLQLSMERLATSPDLGVWGSPEEAARGGDYAPNPLWKRMSGNLFSGKDPKWQNTFSVKVGSEWVSKGSGSAIYNKVYTDKSKEGSQKGAGGRRNLIIYEEVGLFPELTTTWGSDDAVVAIDGVQFGTKLGIGTSGNMSTIAGARKIFTHPKRYNCLSFPSTTDGDEHCFFLPAYMVDKRFKDENGNTDLDAARAFYDNALTEKVATGDPEIINSWKMKYPTRVEHMWVEHLGSLLPSEEAEARIKELLIGNLYEKIGRPVKLTRTSAGDVESETLHVAEPFYHLDFKVRETMMAPHMIYTEPWKRNGITPPDAYIATYDPNVADDPEDINASISAIQIWGTERYMPYGAPPEHLAATLYGRHPKGLDGFHEEALKLFDYYGIGRHGVWYESNRGDRFRAFLIRKNRLYMACLQPQYEKGQYVFLRNTIKTGFAVGNRESKLELIKRFSEFLLEEYTFDGENRVRIFDIPCIFTLRQIAAFSLKKGMNFDAVSAALGWPLARAEREHWLTEDIRKQNGNPLKLLTRQFKHHGQKKII